ncbi:hypothetical protein B1T31_04655 [Staphylococcus aureus]|nr:hypothetical protein BJN19_14415 [Staphylococcus aureus]OQZ09498.1 hypothetical protein BZ161_05880 [Staphylococcus aureus]OQZ12875.1 hypothetical protein BZ162_03845 [Staphylococcus aureus]PHJ44531.1 hypothetical protein AXX07_14305 [Staphylococcus aureus]PHJ45523.1 hypothetical protein AXX06_14305 [Staphylococcus aureus]
MIFLQNLFRRPTPIKKKYFFIVV